jgi:hypothetical protein
MSTTLIYETLSLTGESVLRTDENRHALGPVDVHRMVADRKAGRMDNCVAKQRAA